MLDKNSKIMILGYLGMVGSAIYRDLQKKGYNNFILKDYKDIDLRRQKLTELLFENENPDYVILAAAKVGGIIANDTYKADFIYDNIAIAMNVIEAARKTQVKKLLNLGSSCIYPKYAPQPMKEDYLLTGELEPTNEPYAIAKIAAIKLCKYFNHQFGTNFISVMPTNLYGPNDNFNLETSHVLPALIRKILLAKALNEGNFEFIKNDLKKRQVGFGYDQNVDFSSQKELLAMLENIGITPDYFKAWGTGEVYREFLFVEDMADACIFLFENKDYQDIGEFVNIGTGEDITIKDLIFKIKNITSYKGSVKFDTAKPDGTPRKRLDTSRLHALGWRHRTNLDEGIRLVIEHYLQ